jgi:murein DD-endopeptidase MepM/ murein hydrolase activator NlpD
MFNKINIKFGLVIVVLLLGLSSNAQSVAEFRQAHRRLLAKQERVDQKITLKESRTYARSLYGESEGEDIYSSNWNSKELISYHDVPVPSTKTINLGNYYIPVRNSSVITRFGKSRLTGISHRGVDLKASVGDTVRAAFDGKVRLTKFERDNYGFFIVIRHDNGLETVYAHLSKFLVKSNQRVKAGTPIALSGNTGKGGGPRLHFEVRYMDIPVNPESIFDFERRGVHHSTYTFNKNANQINSGGQKVTSSRRRRK